jgi:hypothetical protein
MEHPGRDSILNFLCELRGFTFANFAIKSF